MPFYLTRDPVPSADMRNVFDNAQNLDLALNDITSSFWSDRLGRSRMSWFGLESAFTVKLSDFESRFSTQIVEQETTFDASQADKENRFQAFLDSSGYVFLGDYEDGPFQFSARNQYIRYNDQYYRLNAATGVGFTTTGTDSTSFTNDVTHFVLMDGDTLRQNLGSGEGFKYIGRVASYAALKNITPDSAGQRILLASYYANGIAGGGEFVSVAGTAVDDGGTICVPTGTTSYYWQRVFKKDVVNPFAFGAKAQPNVDDSDAFRRMLAAGYRIHDCLGKSFWFAKNFTMVGDHRKLRNGNFYVMDGFQDAELIGVDGSYCAFRDLWGDCNGTVAAGVFAGVDPVKGVSGTTNCKSFISNKGVAHHCKVTDCYVTRTQGGSPAFGFPGVDKCSHVKVVNCTVEFSGSMFFTQSAYNDVINPVCMHINDAGIAFNTGGAKFCRVKGGYVHNNRYGGVAVESGSHDVQITGVTFTQPPSNSAGFVVQRGDILIASFDSISGDCYNIGITNCMFNAGGSGVPSTETSYKQSIYITNGYNINIRSNTYITNSTLGTPEIYNSFIYLQPGLVGKPIHDVNISGNDITEGVLLKIWSSIPNTLGNILVSGNTFNSSGAVIRIPIGNNVQYYAGYYRYGIRVIGNTLNTPNMLYCPSNASVNNDTVFNGNTYPAGNTTFLNTTQASVTNMYGVKIGNERSEFLSNNLPTKGKWTKGDVVNRDAVTAGGAIGWVCASTGVFSNTTWVANTAFNRGHRITLNGNSYECVVAGTSGSTGPVGTTLEAIEVDGTASWKNIGAGAPTFLSLGNYSA